MENKLNDLIGIRVKALELASNYYSSSNIDKIIILAKNFEEYLKKDINISDIKDDSKSWLEALNSTAKRMFNNKLNVKIKKLTKEAIIPTYAKEGDAGLDFTAINYEYKSDIDCHVFGTGIAMEIPKGYVGLCFPRSSNRKTDLYLTNSVGVIDSGYRGEVMASFKNRDFTPEVIAQLRQGYEVGDRVFQMIILPYPKINFVEVDELSFTERGDNGHGSSGR